MTAVFKIGTPAFCLFTRSEIRAFKLSPTATREKTNTAEGISLKLATSTPWGRTQHRITLTVRNLPLLIPLLRVYWSAADDEYIFLGSFLMQLQLPLPIATTTNSFNNMTIKMYVHRQTEK